MPNKIAGKATRSATAGPSKEGPIEEIDVLWLNAGVSCDGDTIATTAATHPSVEDLVLGALPWIPKVNFHNFAAAGALDPFILFVKGSIRNETNKAEGYWASLFSSKAVMTYGRAIHALRWFYPGIFKQGAELARSPGRMRNGFRRNSY